MGLLIRNARRWPSEGDVGLVDVVVGQAHISGIGPAGAAVGGDQVIDAAGGWVMPGLHDHHVHLRAAAAAARSVSVGPEDVSSPGALQRRLAEASQWRPDGWVRAVGYHESVAGPLDRTRLDALSPEAPVRVQHTSGIAWVLNSAALGALGIDDHDGARPSGAERDAAGRLTGRLFREDEWLRARLAAIGADDTGGDRAALRHWSHQRAGSGLTGCTDATPDRGPDDVEWFQESVACGDLVQRLCLMAPAASAPPEGTPDGRALITIGPEKIMLDDHDLPTLDDLVHRIGQAHAANRPVAVHCVTRVQAVLATAALVDAGSRPGDRIEHGAVLGIELLGVLAQLGVVVVTQPAMAAAHGDRYRREVPVDDIDDLWRAASLRQAGVGLAGGTDAPHGPADPWTVVRGAIDRRTPGGHILGPAERLEPAIALGLLLGHPDRPAISRRVRAGEPADLCVLASTAQPWGDHDTAPSVLATVVAGQIVHVVDGVDPAD